MEGVVLTSSPFYLANAPALSALMAVVADNYRWSVKIEQERDANLLSLGDVMRMAGNQVVVAVSYICGGWEHAKTISDELWPIAWASQHGD